MPASIYFFCEDIKFRLNSINKIKSWIKNVVKTENKDLGELTYVFCSDAFLLEINNRYLNHKTFTDIITFDTSENSSLIEGEIYISIERVKENAAKYGVSFDEELHRVMIHGVLHLLGYKDKSRQQKLMMRKKEHTSLSLRTF